MLAASLPASWSGLFDLFLIADTPAGRIGNRHAWSRFPLFLNLPEPVTRLERWLVPSAPASVPAMVQAQRGHCRFSRGCGQPAPTSSPITTTGALLLKLGTSPNTGPPSAATAALNCSAVSNSRLAMML